MKESIKRARRLHKAIKKIIIFILFAAVSIAAAVLLRPYYPEIKDKFKFFTAVAPLDTSEIDLYYGLLSSNALPGKDIVLDLGVGSDDDLQLAVDRLKDAMGLKGYTVWLGYHNDEKPPAFIQKLNDRHVNLLISRKITQRREQFNLLSHELSHIYVWKMDPVVFEKCDQEILTDCASIFLGLGVIVLNGFTDETKMTFDGYNTQKRLFGYLSPEQFGYLFARHCKERGVPERSVRVFLNASGRKYFDIGSSYLNRSNLKVKKRGKPIPGIYWCPKCVNPVRISLSGEAKSLDCSGCKK